MYNKPLEIANEHVEHICPYFSLNIPTRNNA